MSNYEAAKTVATYEPNEWNAPAFAQANVLATLALVDEMREARKPVGEVNEVHLMHAEMDMELGVIEVFRDRTKAYERRDELNAKAEGLKLDVRYIVKTVGLV